MTAIRITVLSAAAWLAFQSPALAHPGHAEPGTLSERIAHAFASGEILFPLAVLGALMAAFALKRARGL